MIVLCASWAWDAGAGQTELISLGVLHSFMTLCIYMHAINYISLCPTYLRMRPQLGACYMDI